MRKNLGFIFLLIFLISFSSAADTKTTFIIGGCSGEHNNQEITAAKGTCYINSGSDANGKYYCDSDGEFRNTLLLSNGCSLGKNFLPVPLISGCCPVGYYCDEVSPSRFQCLQMTEECSSFETQSKCEEWPCIWIEESKQCMGDKFSLSCGFYKTSEECKKDVLDLGKVGVGTDVLGKSVECAGSVYSISEGDSNCTWNETYPDGEKCYLNYVAEERYSAGTFGSFQCSNIYQLGNCIDGKQKVTWTSSNKSLSGGEVPEDCLKAFGCLGGEDSRYCGDETIKLPGFGLSSLIISLAILALIYIIKVARFK